MKINRNILPINEAINFDEDIDFSNYAGDSYHVKKINSCHLVLNVVNQEDFITLSFRIKGEVTTTCAYTLDDVIYPFNIHEIIELNGDEDDEFEIKNNEIDIDEIIITLIVQNIPMKVIKKGAKLPSDGEGYIVRREDDVKEEKRSSPFDILDELELDDD